MGLNRGIDLGGRSAYLYSCRVARNEVLSGDRAESSRPARSRPAPRSTSSATRSRRAATGIVVGPDATVDSNAVNKLGDNPGTDGIVVAAGAFAAAPGHVRITGNRVHDRAGHGIALLTAVRTFMVKENIVADVGDGIVIEGKGSAERVAVDNNEVFDVAAAEGAATRRSGSCSRTRRRPASSATPSPASGSARPMRAAARGDRRARRGRRARRAATSSRRSAGRTASSASRPASS